VSNYQEGGFIMIMSMANVCAIPAVGCTTAAGAASSTGTPWNGTSTTNDCTIGSTTGRCNQLASLKDQNYLIQMDNIYANLPATIGGISKDTIVRNTTWNMDGFSRVETGLAVRSVGYNAPQVRRVNLASVYEWQNGRDNGTGGANGWGVEPIDGSLGNLFCQARFGTICMRSDSPSFFNAPNPAPLTGTYTIPWLRSALTDYAADTWFLHGTATNSLHYNQTDYALGLLPVMWIKSNLTTGTGGGTFENPYEIAPPQTTNQIPGQVINIPIAGVDVPWLVSNYNDSGYTMIALVAFFPITSSPEKAVSSWQTK
ncbi:MAG: hypothetical protein LBD23_01275, partial [Oscillospiraceae bacterium]|jgi:hypothetical protein|nr:hypothetical protein [Oscillospiraceae bacterium]